MPGERIDALVVVVVRIDGTERHRHPRYPLDFTR
jgi:hypothetical protein